MGRRREQEERILLKYTMVLAPFVFRESVFLGDSVLLVDPKLRFPGAQKEKVLILAVNKGLAYFNKGVYIQIWETGSF